MSKRSGQKAGKKIRLDALMLSRGFEENKSKAQARIMAGEVKVTGKIVTKPGIMVAEDTVIDVLQKLSYVSRGGLKMASALEQFDLDVKGMVAMDIGASTGGFTDCLLQHGAAKVYAIDVGYGQLDYKLRQDARVVVMDKTNAHYAFVIPQEADLANVDVSFISVTKVIPNILKHLKRGGLLLILLKPQFEAKREQVGKGGVIRDTAIHADVLARFLSWAIIQHGLNLRGLIASPVPGAEGNKEFFILLKT